jgi:hypothetical protein
MAAGFAGCGSPGKTPHADAPTTTQPTKVTTTTVTPTRVQFGSGSVAGPVPTTTLPQDNGLPIPPDFAAGQNILITPDGFEPKVLEANVSAPVVWTNLSGKPQTIVFVDFPVESGTIPPGGTFTWSTQDAIAFTYLSGTGLSGKLGMNPVNP